MSKNNKDFFKKKLAWSRVKDELLYAYLPQYFQKVLTTGRPILYVDCFAGKGRFDDGNDGSPRIALNIRKEKINVSHAKNPRIDMTFIDVNYASDLIANTAEYAELTPIGDKQIISGRYEEVILPLLSSKQSVNVFLYIDPYGIEALDFELFEKALQCGHNTFEMLINMNSFGFLRAGCSALRVPCDDIDVSEMVEYAPSEFDSSADSIRNVNRIAGGEYWQEIVRWYQKEKESDQDAGYKAEAKLSHAYKMRLREKFRYVLDLPIKISAGNHPKYRMIHVTNHQDGCNLMANNMVKRKEELVIDFHNHRQMQLFNTDLDNNIIQEEDIYDQVREAVDAMQKAEYVSLFTANFFTERGVFCSTGQIHKALATMEKHGALEVIRDPAQTETGRMSSYWEEDSRHHVIIRRRSR